MTSLASFVLALLAAALPLAATADEASKSKPAQFDWTTIQDLKPDANSINRPVGDKWMVVVGASKFKEKRLESPFAMDKAAEAFYDYAVDPNAGRFAKDHVRLLLNANATRQNIMTSFGNAWLSTLVKPDDLVVVFISTLSFPTTDGQAYLCAYDCAIDNVYSTCLSMKDLMDTIKHNVVAKRIVLVVQACYSGIAELNDGSKSLAKSYNLDLDQLSLGQGYVILSSSRPDQITWSSGFSDNLTAALRKDSGLVPLADAFSEAKAATESATAASGHGERAQTPVMKSAWQGKGLTLGIPPLAQTKVLPASVGNFLAAESYYLKANQAVVAADYPTAIDNYELALKVDPHYADAWCDYASVLVLEGELDKANIAYAQALAEKPDDSLLRTNYALVCAKSGRAKAAKEELQNAISLDPKNKTALVALANMQVQEGDYVSAIENFQKAIALYPSSASLHDRLAYALGRFGELDSAVKQSEEAVRLDPKSVPARMNLAANELLAGDKNAAVTAYNDVLNISPNNADAHYCLSRVLETMGKKAEAASEVRAFLKAAPAGDSRVAEAEEHLQALQ